MTEKNKKQFGVWMDSHNATIVGKEGNDTEEFTVIGHVGNIGPDKNSNEHTSNNHEISLTHKFFKEITAKMPNIDEIHVSGTGQIQEEFIKYLAHTAHYKNVKSSASTSNRMSDENFALFVRKHFN